MSIDLDKETGEKWVDAIKKSCGLLQEIEDKPIYELTPRDLAKISDVTAILKILMRNINCYVPNE